MAEQLVEMPTIISYSSLQRTLEQHVDIPVLGGIGTGGGPSRFSPKTEFNSDAFFQETLFQVEVVLVLSQDKVHLLLTLQLVLKSTLMSLNFSKQCEAGIALESESARQCQPIHASCSAGGRALVGLHRVGAALGRRRWQDLERLSGRLQLVSRSSGLEYVSPPLPSPPPAQGGIQILGAVPGSHLFFSLFA